MSNVYEFPESEPEQPQSFAEKVAAALRQELPDDLTAARYVVSQVYCVHHGLDINNLDIVQLHELRSQRQWQDPFGE